MAQGLQCWNASGTLIVDLQDYNLRYVGSQTQTLNTGVSQWNFAYSGMTADGWIVYPQVGNLWQVFAVRCYDGGYRVSHLPSGTLLTTRSITFDIWRYE